MGRCMKIQGRTLTISTIGKRVKYVPNHANGNQNHDDCEVGNIIRWTDKGVFVKYRSNTLLTNASNLIWCDV